MPRFRLLLPCFLCLAAPLAARHGISVCGTSGETARETLFLHRQSLRARSVRALAQAAPSANRDAGNIAIIEDSNGVVARQNPFTLNLKTLTFTPTTPQAAAYRYSVADQGYDAAAADAGAPLAALDDDDTRQVSLPFAFPFFGAAYNQVFVNSDGNLTFTAGDSASTDRSLGRMTAGVPRISPLFDDLDPAETAGGVRVLSEATRVVVSWVAVPEWQTTGIGAAQTFQVKLYPDGHIDFSYSGATPTSAVVGIAPGNLAGATSLVSFLHDPSAAYSAAVAERFGSDVSIDIVTTAQQFYETHEDAYDYLMIYNNEGILAMSTAVAYENTVRSSGSGYGVDPLDTGGQFGSASRLQAVINMGPLSEYPTDPNAVVPLRLAAGDTPLTILAHETGHLFLAFASVPDPADPGARPMLNTDLAHWSFVFNSEASLLEGERIDDRKTSASPEFLTTDTVQDYAPLDQYLMGFLPPDPQQVPPTFLVTGAPSYLLSAHPARGVSFNGTRRDIAIGDVIQAMGRRTPDSTVAQHRFRFGFILVVPQGSQPSAADLAQIDTYRQEFEDFYATASANIASADTTLERSMKLSLFPSAGVVVGGSGTASLTLATPPSADMTVQLQAPKGNLKLPASVTIPAGAASAAVPFTGVKKGVEEVSATAPAGVPYETAFARVQVADASILSLRAVSGDHQTSTGSAPLADPIVVELTDGNNLPYPGAGIKAVASAGGAVTPALAVADARGQASFRWTPGSSAANQLTLAVDVLPSVSLTLNSGAAVPVATAVSSAASATRGIAPGSLGTLWGVNLAGGQELRAGSTWPPSLGGVSVRLNGTALPLLYAKDTQINFYLPSDTPRGSSTLAAVTPSGAEASITVNVAPVAPAIFPGAVLHAGTAVSAVTTPVRAGDYIEIYCTGLGPTQAAEGLQQTLLAPIVFFGATPVTPSYSGLAPGFVGLYQVDAQVPSGLAPGLEPLTLSLSLVHSNPVSIAVE